MNEWQSLLKTDPLDWLLEKDNPSVQYYTLTDILEKPQNDPEVRQIKKEIMEIGVVPKILSKQKEGGYWESPENFYIKTKYKGTVWQLIILAELGASINDDRVKAACEIILEYSQDRENGGFSYSGSKKRGGHHSRVLPCLTGNVVWSLIRFGYLEDPRIQHGIEWITRYQRFDDGSDAKPEGWPYEKYENCWGRHTCHMGVVKALKACAEILPEKRTKNVERLINNGAEFMLRHHIYKRSHNLVRISKPSWLKLSFPWMGNTDVLEVLLVLTKLGYQDRRMREAVNLVLSKQNEHGRWMLERTYNGRFQVNIEQKGKESKWITLNALKILKKQFELID